METALVDLLVGQCTSVAQEGTRVPQNRQGWLTTAAATTTSSSAAALECAGCGPSSSAFNSFMRCFVRLQDFTRCHCHHEHQDRRRCPTPAQPHAHGCRNEACGAFQPLAVSALDRQRQGIPVTRGIFYRCFQVRVRRPRARPRGNTSRVWSPSCLHLSISHPGSLNLTPSTLAIDSWRAAKSES